MNSNQSYSLGGRHYSQTLNKDISEKVNPTTKKLVEIIKGKCSICNRKKSQILPSKWLEEKIFLKMLNALTVIVPL